MERNDKCFCGSGLKYKRCHYNMKENSTTGEIIKLYNKIDNKIENELKNRNINKICKEGCTECCSDYFSITEGEFAVIIDYLIKEKGREYVNEIISKGLIMAQQFKKECPSYYAQLEENITGYSVEENLRITLQNMPDKQGFRCVFLDDNGSCATYKVRPFICRQHGMCYTDLDPDHRVCSKILSSEDRKGNMVNIEEFMDELNGFEIIKSRKYNMNITRRKYPVFYWIKLYFEKEQNIDMYLNHPICRMLFDRSKDEFINKIIEVHRR